MDTYEKKYKEANDKIAARFGTNVAKEIFTDLYESEDERIRKEIMDFIDTNTIDSDERRNRWFSYLEKYKPISFTSLEDTKVKMSLMQYISELNQDVVHLHPGIETCNEWIDWLEKQGEQKPSLRERYDKIKNSEWFKKTHEGMSISDDEKVDDVNYCSGCINCVDGDMKETEHTIKPKFHEGDWITNGDYTWKIVEVKPLDYILQSQDGNIVDDTISHVDEQFHSFTIEDAKDGDVLTVDSKPFIYNGSKNEVTVGAYCGFNTKHKFSFAYNYVINQNITPATKEQCDLLFSKMKEAGYEWSEETHELKKISQRTISAEAKEALYDKPAEWSEEDEVRLQACLDTLQAKSLMGKVDTQITMWLKSLKDRIGG